MRRDAGNNHGFVLLVMLVFMQVTALLITREICTLIYVKKSLSHHSMITLQEREMLAVMELIDEYKRPVCMINNITHAAISSMNLRWWQQHGCMIRYQGNEYFFVREYLGTDVCAGIRNQQKQIVATKYYRNTLHYHSALNADQELLIQDTLAIQSNLIPVCSGKLKLISEGRKMLRHI